MVTPHKASCWMLVAAIILGTASDVAIHNAPLFIGGQRVLIGDFHVHSFPLSWSTLDPFATVLQARQQGLDVIAMAGHNHVWVGKVGKWFSRFTGGPIVLVTEEIVSPEYHLLAVGIKDTISWKLSSALAIKEVHRQGGVAIAAHPVASFWSGYDARARSELDGAEALHPLIYTRPEKRQEFQRFLASSHASPIGDSDFHGLGPIGMCRTLILANDDSENSILEALRQRGSLAFCPEGNLLELPRSGNMKTNDPRIRERLSPPVKHESLAAASRIVGIVAVLGLVLFRPRR